MGPFGPFEGALGGPFEGTLGGALGGALGGIAFIDVPT